MVATLQLEVAQRIMAGANDADYGLLSLLIQLNYEPVEIFKIPATCFYPPPDVDSACIKLVRRATHQLDAGGIHIRRRIKAGRRYLEDLHRFVVQLNEQ